MSNLCGDNVTQTKEEASKVSPQISYHDIATKLLQDRLLLTALELHTELVESGRELPKLKEFFSNPGNFEQSSRPEISSPIPRSGSQATLDSLDLTRFSEDGERGVDERVAVLEFELRKAKETITALRNNLTVATESESTVPDTGIPKSTSLEAIKPHEQRALNFLINEYLLLHGYKLTSITFADENENQDFEDWDDVGLNIPKPNELLVLYRDAVKHTGCSSASVECQVNISMVDETKNEKISLLSVQNEKLVATIAELENEKKELQRQCDSLLTEQNKSYEQSGPCDVEQFIATSTENDSNSTNSTSPERFEMIDKPEKGERLKSESSLATLDDDESTVSLNENDADWTRVTLPTDNVSIQKKSMDNDASSLKSEVINIPNSHSNRNLPGVYQKELYIECFKNISSKFSLIDDLLTENITFEYLVKMLTICLPRIIPTMILKKREEVLPLLISAVNLNTSSAQRDVLLQQLFNLKKKPTEEERQKILAGIVHIAKYCGEHMIENEILPQCWEQINHKNVENRLLVIESCISLAPYISSAIRNSLMLSMLQQMVLEDREKSVRELAVQALALIAGLCNDTDKYTQFEDLALGILDDPDVSVVTVATNLLIPVLAKWALDLDKFQQQLMKKLFKKIKRLLNRSDSLSEEKITQILSTINILLPFVLISVTSVDAVINSITEDYENELRPEFIQLCTSLTNPYNFYENENPIGSIVNTFESLILENDFESWPEFDWFEEVMLQELLSVANHVNVSQENNVTSVINLFRNICVTFGKNFTLRKLRPLFESHIQNIESSLVNFNIENSSQRLCLIPVYLIGVLNKADFAEEISNLIKRLICVLPMSGTSSKCLEISISGLCENTDLQTTVIASLWDGVVHQNPPVRCATANLFSSVIGKVDEGLLINRVAPALVTLASDPDVYVRTATIPCLGNLIISSNVKEVRDKAYMQLQSALTDPSVKEHHSLLCQLAATLGKIATAADPWFREEVILPQLAGISAYTSQLTNQTRRKDLGLVLLEAFPAVIYSPLSKQTIATCLLPGLKYLESLETQEIASHRETISTMIRDAELRLQGNSTTISVSHPSQVQGRSERISAIGHNVNQSVEDMRQRMSKILKPNVGKSSNLTNLQGIFKKK